MAFFNYCILSSNSVDQKHPDKYSNFEFLAGVDSVSEIQPKGACFDELKKYYAEKKDWLFGYFSYELKDETEHLSSTNPDRLDFPTLHFFQPRYVIAVKDGMIHFYYLEELDTEDTLRVFVKKMLTILPEKNQEHKSVHIIQGLNKSDYIEKIIKIKEHIQRGDIYEINFCSEFFSENAVIDPDYVFKRMNAYSPMPFAAMYRLAEKYILCASPERFMAKRKNKIISQPIKGTARRGSDPESDKKIIKKLYEDPKERSENVMIVDLVRNDLSRTAEKGSVKVESLFEVSSFKNLHQMISTITSEMRNTSDWLEVIRNAFPMGSMTGAPKVKAMELIEAFEERKRGVYSGSIGYINPEGDFDFNVVIRSILYNTEKSTLSFMVGSAITVNADPEQEYLECLLKAESMKNALTGE